MTIRRLHGHAQGYQPSCRRCVRLRTARQARARKALLKQRIKTRAAIRRKGRSRFPKQRQPDFLKWLERLPCLVAVNAHLRKLYQPSIGCGTMAHRHRVENAHVKTRGSGGADLGNTVRLCPKHHDEQEGNRTAFEKKYELDLVGCGWLYGQQYLKQVALGWTVGDA